MMYICHSGQVVDYHEKSVNENAVISEKECQNTGQSDGGKECTKSTTDGRQMAVHTSYSAELFRNQRTN